LLISVDMNFSCK